MFVSLGLFISKDNNMKKLIPCLFLVLTTALLPAQNAPVHVISGTIVGYDGEALVGATIAVAGKSTGTITDLNGKFKLTVANDALLHISYLACQPIELYPDEIEYELKGRIEMKEDNWLKEVVITAKGVASKSVTSTCYWVVNDSIGQYYPSLQPSAVPRPSQRPWQYYPNPSTDGVTVSTETPGGFINVFSSDGKRVVRQPVCAVLTKVDLLGLAAGMYILSYENGGLVQVIGKVSLLRN